MLLIRIFILVIMIYLASKIFSQLFRAKPEQTHVKGNQQAPTLDLSGRDVEDVDFKETPRKEGQR